MLLNWPVPGVGGTGETAKSSIFTDRQNIDDPDLDLDSEAAEHDADDKQDPTPDKPDHLSVADRPLAASGTGRPRDRYAPSRRRDDPGRAPPVITDRRSAPHLRHQSPVAADARHRVWPGAEAAGIPTVVVSAPATTPDRPSWSRALAKMLGTRT